MKYFVPIFLLLLVNCFSDPIEKNKKYKANEYLDIQNKYKNSIRKYKQSSQEYNIIQQSVFQNHTEIIKNFWPIVEFSTPYKLVEYAPDYTYKKIIHFKNKELSFEAIADDINEAKKTIEKLFLEVQNETINTIYQKDIIEDEILTELNKTKLEIQSNQTILGNLLKEKEINQLSEQINSKNILKTQYKKNNIYKLILKLPKNFITRGTKKFSLVIKKNAQKYMIPPELIFAIIHIESAYNPMGRSIKPSYGLMQIIPRRTGAKGYQFIHKKEGIPIPSYLYNSVNNINVGSAYLHLLFHKHLKNIVDEKSKLYCIIASYNYGLDNLTNLFAGAFEVDKAINRINNMTSDEVYHHLQKNLPEVESKIYLKKVIEKMKQYSDILDKNLI